MKLCLFAALKVLSRARGKLWDVVAIVEVTTWAGARAMCHIAIEAGIVLIGSIRAENRRANTIDAVELVGVQNVDFLDLLCGFLCHGILPFLLGHSRLLLEGDYPVHAPLGDVPIHLSELAGFLLIRYIHVRPFLLNPETRRVVNANGVVGFLCKGLTPKVVVENCWSVHLGGSFVYVSLSIYIISFIRYLVNTF
jgi:hypothetical protein